jgi:hypothetical protein
MLTDALMPQNAPRPMFVKIVLGSLRACLAVLLCLGYLKIPHKDIQSSSAELC